jgi:drug/metabolite transporter (DMT)-like permease
MPSPAHGHLAGVVAGIAAAAAAAVSYLVLRHHGNRSAGGSKRLLVLAHFVMGLACLPLVWILWPESVPTAAESLPPLFGAAATYLAGQAMVFATLRRMPASRLAPLLGLKIVLLAAIVSLLLGDRLSAMQWAAVGASVAAAAMLDRSGAAASPAALAGVLAACLMFAICDLLSVRLIDVLESGGKGWWSRSPRLHAGCFAMATTYVLCGVVAACLLPWTTPRDRRDWAAASQYSLAWLAGMVALYACFGFVGAVFGNVLFSTRGIMAVVLGALLAHLGWHDLEEKVDRGTLLRRLTAAVLMTAAIAAYVA